MVFMTQISHNWLVFNRPLLHLFRHHSNPLLSAGGAHAAVPEKLHNHKSHSLQLGLWQLCRGTMDFRICFKVLFLLGRKGTT